MRYVTLTVLTTARNLEATYHCRLVLERFVDTDQVPLRVKISVSGLVFYPPERVFPDVVLGVEVSYRYSSLN